MCLFAITVAKSKNSTETQTARFKFGLFKVTQPAKAKGYTVLKLQGPIQCGAAKSFAPDFLATRSLALRTISNRGRRLWGSGKGKFTSSGRRGSGSARGTTWQVTDRCDGTTLIKSIEGNVKAVDFKTGKSKLLKTGQSFVAGKQKKNKKK